MSKSMELYDIIIVGSGPAATSALKSVTDRRVLVLDTGIVASSPANSLNESIVELKRSDKIRFEEVIGNNFESLNNISQDYLSPKVKAPLMRFIVEKYAEFNKFKTKNFFVLGSYAKGGLSNAWGAGAIRYSDENLSSFPIRYSDLEVFYNEITNDIGISGANDDLEEDFVKDENLLPPPKLNFLSQYLLRQYQKHRSYIQSYSFKIGYPRSAYITAEKKQRPIYDYKGLEFFKPYIVSIYNSKPFIEKLFDAHSNIRYLNNKLVTTFKESDNAVEVFTHDIETGRKEVYSCRKLILAAGCLNTTKIVLNSYRDFNTKLPILDNLITYIPFVSFRHIGKKDETNLMPLQLVLMAKDKHNSYLASIYKLNSTLCGDYLFDFPLSIQGAIRAVKYLAPSVLIMQVFYPDHPKPENFIRLTHDGQLEIVYENEMPRGMLERKIIKAFRRLGFFSASFLIKKLTPGNSFHYSGTLPMKDAPSMFETDKSCRLHGTKHVYIVDASVFPSLPAKNNTLTIMANAMRVGRIVRESI